MAPLTRLWNLLRRARVDRGLRQEFETHLALIEEDERSRGAAAGEARRNARLRFGNPVSYREWAVDAAIATGIENAAADLRHAVRMLGRNPGFTAVAIASLALGIGVNAAMFSVIDAVLLRPLPYPHPGQLVRLTQYDGKSDVSITEYELLEEHSRAFSKIAAHRGAGERSLGSGGAQDWLETMYVTGGFFETLDVTPAIGREFEADETRTGGPQAVIFSDGIWRRRFAADPAIIGRLVTLDGTPFKVVGVLPADFWFPQPADAFIPLRPSDGLDDLGANTQVVARLKNGVDLRQARAETAALTEALRQAMADRASRGYRGLSVSSFQAWLVGDIRLNLMLLFGATGLLLVIACVNLAMLLVARFTTREREFAVRIALGGGRRRLLAQSLMENLVLTVLGAGASVLAAHGLLRALLSWAPFNLPAAAPIRVDARVLGFALSVALATCVVFTLVPMLTARRLNVHDALKSTARTTGPNIRTRARNVLVIGEVALSTTLLVAAGLLIHSLYRLQHERLGFEPDRLITFVTPFDPLRTAADRAASIRALRDRLPAVPGVREVAATNILPLTGRGNLPTQREAHPEQSVGGMEIRTVTPNYFDVLGIPLKQGRSFTPADRAASLAVAIVNDTVARSWWPAGGAIGDRLVIGMFQGKKLMNGAPREVVGIAGDTKTLTLQGPARPTVFVPLDQTLGDVSRIAWIVRADGSPNAPAALRAAVAGIDPAQRIVQFRMLGEIVASTTAASRFNASLFALFAAVAMILAGVGLYGVLSFVVAQRRHEVGTRIALGASGGDVLALFLRQGLTLTSIGLALGLGAALLLARWLSALLFGVQARDPVSFAAVAILLLGVGAMASYVPARRAASTDPMSALRAE